MVPPPFVRTSEGTYSLIICSSRFVNWHFILCEFHKCIFISTFSWTSLIVNQLFVYRQMLCYRRRLPPTELQARIEAVDAKVLRDTCKKFIFNMKPALSAVGEFVGQWWKVTGGDKGSDQDQGAYICADCALLMINANTLFL